MMTNNKEKRGMTLLIAVLTAGVLLSISLSIFNIAIKEIIISSTGRESQVAFYAADSGIECALYWDIRKAEFEEAGEARIECAGDDIRSDGPLHVFTFNIPDSPACVEVSVDKRGTDGYATIIESRGYNSCDSDNPRRTERGVRLKY
ncbi:MAG: pilus assembly PilX N-terminal domain-containing protein [Patescibacteria group bacterium]